MFMLTPPENGVPEEWHEIERWANKGHGLVITAANQNHLWFYKLKSYQWRQAPHTCAKDTDEGSSQKACFFCTQLTLRQFSATNCLSENFDMDFSAPFTSGVVSLALWPIISRTAMLRYLEVLSGDKIVSSQENQRDHRREKEQRESAEKKSFLNPKMYLYL